MVCVAPVGRRVTNRATAFRNPPGGVLPHLSRRHRVPRRLASCSPRPPPLIPLILPSPPAVRLPRVPSLLRSAAMVYWKVRSSAKPALPVQTATRATIAPASQPDSVVMASSIRSVWSNANRMGTVRRDPSVRCSANASKRRASAATARWRVQNSVRADSRALRARSATTAFAPICRSAETVPWNFWRNANGTTTAGGIRRA